MDLTSLMGTMLSKEGLAGIGKAANVSTNDVSNILSQAMPMFLQGVGNQANSEQTSASFVQALTDHAQHDTTDITQFLNGVDIEDGAKIVQHLLGSNASSAVAQASGVSQKDAGNVMSAAAPLLMSLLGKETTGKAAKKNSTTSLVNGLLSNVDVSKIAKAALAAAAAGAVKNAVSGNKKTSKKKNGIDLSDGLDVSDVVNIVGKIIK